jgi:hypothetical protein
LTFLAWSTIMPKVRVAVPHQLSPEAALEKVRPALEKTVTDFQGHDLELNVSGTTGTFRFKSMAFTISGKLAVEPQEVVVEVDLPFAAMMFKDKAEKAIGKNVSRALAPPAPG